LTREDRPGCTGVSVRACRLDVPDRARLKLAACLAPDELERAGRLRSTLHRERVVVAWAWRRHALAALLDCRAGEVAFVAGRDGKPRVLGSDLRFSASRSDGIAVLAISREVEVGVDVEAIRAIDDLDRLARRFMSASERAALAARPAARRQAGWFDCWTRKEAYVKGLGTGLSLPLAGVEVWSGDERPATIGGWRVLNIRVAPGYAAAVAGSDAGTWDLQPGVECEDPSELHGRP
jgi:4'-phosphopantetheinyl transferase